MFKLTKTMLSLALLTMGGIHTCSNATSVILTDKLLLACFNQQWNEAKNLIAQPSTNLNGEDGLTPLWLTCIFYAPEICKLLIEKDVNLFTQVNAQETPWDQLSKNASFSGENNRADLLISLLPLKNDNNAASVFLENVVTTFTKNMTNTIDSATLTPVQKKVLLEMKSPLTQPEKVVLISIIQKFIKLLYTTQKSFLEDVSIAHKNTLGFNDKELALCAKLFTNKSPLLNLLAQYNQAWSQSEKYFFKNIKNIVPEPMGKKTKKQRPYKDINIFFQS
ncbi:TPA: hypothetical protein DDZ86_00140 [Candidatus Dependentiae bacterium]|nr:hypothetical protein [Candidatus Dependentiae bacterium]